MGIAALLSTLMQWMSSKWTPHALILGALGVLYQNALGIWEHIDWLISEVDALATPAMSGAGLSVNALGLVNYVLPLDLALAQFTLWVPLFLTASSIRLIKSFVPTMAS